MRRYRWVALVLGVLLWGASGQTGAQAVLPENAVLQEQAVPWSMQIVERQGTLGPLQSVVAYRGARTPLTVELTNVSADPLAISVDSLDAQAPRGVLEYRKAESAFAASTWVSGDPTREATSVGGGETVRLVLTLSVPNTARGGDHVIGVQLTDASSGKSETVGVVVQVPGEPRTTELEFISGVVVAGAGAWPVAPTTTTVDYEIRNAGNTVLYGDLEVGVLTLFSQRLVHERHQGAVVLPESSMFGEATEDSGAIGVVAPNMQANMQSWKPAVGDASADWEQSFRGEPSAALPVLVMVIPLLIGIVVLAWGLLKRRSRRLEPGNYRR